MSDESYAGLMPPAHLDLPVWLLLTVIAISGIALLACTGSEPSHRRVAIDVVEGLGLTDKQHDCMVERIETYTDDELAAMAQDNLDLDFTDTTFLSKASPKLQKFISDLKSCMADATTSVSTNSPSPTADSVTGDGTTPTATTTAG